MVLLLVLVLLLELESRLLLLLLLHLPLLLMRELLLLQLLLGKALLLLLRLLLLLLLWLLLLLLMLLLLRVSHAGDKLGQRLEERCGRRKLRICLLSFFSAEQVGWQIVEAVSDTCREGHEAVLETGRRGGWHERRPRHE